jgi:hypothetical protein
LHGDGGTQLFEEVFSKSVKSEGTVKSKEIRVKKTPDRRDPEQSKVKL